MKVLISSKYKHHKSWDEIKKTLLSNSHECITPLDIDLKLFGKNGSELTELEYLTAVKEYYQELKKADVLYVLNFNGDFGKDMMQEIGFAAALGKRIFTLEAPDQEPSLKLVVEKTVKPEDL